MTNNNTGDCNSGHHNSGDHNSGYSNSGNFNSGNGNSGNGNSGYRNSGHYNTGYHNNGRRNSGDCNNGKYNSGHCNSGGGNSGNYNSGNHNSGDYNRGDYNSGHFNTTAPTVRMFNRDTGLQQDEIDLPRIKLPLTEWIPAANMTARQKRNNLGYRSRDGFLLQRSYKEAWAVAWQKMSAAERQEFMDLPNFDAAVFEEITGINVDNKCGSCAADVIEVNGVKYKRITTNE